MVNPNIHIRLLSALLLTSCLCSGQTESDPLVLKKLEWFQDVKLGLLMHWGPYTQWGIVESWSICPEDEGWTQRRGPHSGSYVDYVKAYENLKTTFNPTKFDPERWAKAAHEAGMRYVVFTTKHHDGFSMFDTKQSDYKITDPGCPFSTHPRSNVTKEIFDAFRKRGFGVGAYFSKPDWHSLDYWWPYFPPFDRNVNYDIAKYPEKWESFKRFTKEQIRELMTDYGSVDILWLDGGWVQPMTPTSPRWGKHPVSQDIDMSRIAAMARSLQPGLIIVDRAVEGPFQNYRTPEQEVPHEPPGYLWETCMTMATSWTYVATDTYKPARQLVHLLVDIVAKGGNLLLNVGPSPEGEFAPDAYARMKELGDWMKVNKDAIYGTRAVAPYKEGNICYTKNSDGTVNAIMLLDDERNDETELRLKAFQPQAGTSVRLLGYERSLEWSSEGDTFRIRIPADVLNNPPSQYAWTFTFRPRS